MYRAAMSNTMDIETEQLMQHHYPLHLACYRGDETRVRELLISGRADVYQEDGLSGWTPMHWAAFRGEWKCLELLGHVCGVDLDVTNTRINQTPAHLAAREGHAQCVAWLVHHGISLGIQDHKGDTPLHKAAQKGNLQCVKLLTSHGPLLSTFNHRGLTPMDIAIQYGHTECQEFLDQALSSQHTSFFPTASSPILMNGEDIYQNGTHAGGEGMEMEEEAAGGGGDAMATVAEQQSGFKRSRDDEEETVFKRRRLFAPASVDKFGTVTNNNVVSSYQGVLAMSVEPSKPPNTHHLNTDHSVHALPTQPLPLCPQGDSSTHMTDTSSSSVEDMCNALRVQHGYEALMLHSLIDTDHGH